MHKLRHIGRLDPVSLSLNFAVVHHITASEPLSCGLPAKLHLVYTSRRDLCKLYPSLSGMVGVVRR